jgi:hypothetical protein
MKNTTLMLFTVFMSFTLYSQTIKTDPKKPPLCDERSLYSLQPSIKGQVQAICPLSKETIAKKLNAEVKYLKSHPGLTDKGRIGWVINCKGQVSLCQMDAKTTSPELDKQLETALSYLGDWKPGTLYEKPVDSSVLYVIVITKGVISIE